MNSNFEVISGFRRIEEAEAYVDKEHRKNPDAKIQAVMHGDKPVVVVEMSR